MIQKLSHNIEKNMDCYAFRTTLGPIQEVTSQQPIWLADEISSGQNADGRWTRCYNVHIITNIWPNASLRAGWGSLSTNRPSRHLQQCVFSSNCFCSISDVIINDRVFRALILQKFTNNCTHTHTHTYWYINSAVMNPQMSECAHIRFYTRHTKQHFSQINSGLN